MSKHGALAAVPEDGPLLDRRDIPEEARFDITAMIDLVCLMNIYFMVTSVVAAMAEVDLPLAEHGVAANADDCVVVIILAPIGDGPAQVLLQPVDADGDEQSLTEASDEELDQALSAAVETSGKKTVLVKAEANVLHRDVSRMATAVGRLDEIALNLAVVEYE